MRDTVLIELSYAEFEALIARHPRLLRQLTSRALERADRPVKQANATGRIVTIAVVAASSGMPVGEFTTRLAAQLERLGPLLRLDSKRVDALMGQPGIASAADTSPGVERLLAWLEAREAEHRFLIYEADETPTEWTRRCVRLADRILLVADADAAPAPSSLEEDLFFGGPRASDAYEVLLLLHRDSSCLPKNTRSWLSQRPHLDEHYHVRWDTEQDFGRVARVLAGEAVGVVLGGGGARGFAHIGILRALEESGVPVDFIGGTSMGAALAAQYALGASPAEMEAINRRVWIEIRPHMRVTLPIISLVASTKARECGRMMYGEAEIEDLWIPFFCVSSDLTTARMVVHRSGPLIRAASASASLPVFAEPVVEDGRLLVDGALLNNLPADVMRSLGAGTVIACEVSVEDDETFVSDRIPSPWEVLRGKARFPSLGDVLMRAILLNSAARERSAIGEADLCLRPPVEGFGLMDFSRLPDLVKVGHDYAVEELSAWSNRPPWMNARR